MSARQILGWIVVTLLAVFVVFNLQDARIWFFGIRISMPIGLVVIFSAVMGAGATILFARLRKQRSAKGK